MSYPFVETPSKSQLPPLRIHHFMLWTAVLAVMLTSSKGCSHSETGADVQVSESTTLSFSQGEKEASIPQLLVLSVCLTGLLLGWYWKRKGYTFFDEPGHAAFVLYGMIAAYTIPFAGATSALQYDPPATEQFWLYGLLILGWLVIGIMQLVYLFKYARRFSYRERWSSFFYIKGILTLLLYLSYLLIPLFIFSIIQVIGPNLQLFAVMQLGVPFLFGTIELVYWIKAIRCDLKTPNPYHWTHWLGASTWPAMMIAAIIYQLTLIVTNYQAEWSAYPAN